MQANPTLGILQTLVVGQPSGSAFTRIFQFGMRHAMRMQTIGSAWWQGPAGPFWVSTKRSLLCRKIFAALSRCSKQSDFL